MQIDNATRELYSRQIMMKEIGEAGQRRLTEASVFVAGCGGLGAPVLYYLAAMGIGHLGLCDGDTVSLSNLNRQLLYTMEDLGKPKAAMAQKRLLALNPRLKVTRYDCFLDAELAAAALPAYDIAVDCLDTYEARFVLNDACVMAGKPFVHAGIGEFYGQMMTVTPGKGPCLRCLFPNGIQKGEQGKQFGVVGATAGVLGAMQALEVIKYLIGLPVNNEGLAVFDGLDTRLEKIMIAASPACICGRSRDTNPQLEAQQNASKN